MSETVVNRVGAVLNGEAHVNGCNGHHGKNGSRGEPARTEPLAAVSDGEDVPAAASAGEATAAAGAGAGKPPTPGRDAGGKFTDGNKLGKGNPFSRKLGAMRSAFLGAVSAEDVQAVARKLAELARSGDLAAAQLFLAYAVGKPARVVEPDRLDLEEFALLDSWPTEPQVTRALLDGCEPGQAAEVVRGTSASHGPVEKRVIRKSVPHLEKVLAEQKARVGKPPS